MADDMQQAHFYEKRQREVIRWRILQTLNIGAPYPVATDTLLEAVGGPDMPIRQHDLRREIDYLERRHLVTVEGRGLQPEWDIKLTRHGSDVADYTVECEPGIARPAKYW